MCLDKSMWESLSTRAWDAVFAVLLGSIGLFDLFASDPFPPMMAVAAPDWVFRLYGVYLILGAIFVLAAILWPRCPWARRNERVGMIMIAGATAAISFILMYFMVTEYHSASMFLLTSTFVMITGGSLARWKHLGNAGT